MKQIRVMTFNIRHGRGMDDTIDLQRSANVIDAAGADLVALNEVDRLTRRCGGVDQAAELARLLDMHVKYSPSIPYQGGEYGNAVLSRWPIEASHVHPLPQGKEARTLLHTQVSVRGTLLHFFVTHLGLGDTEQKAQLNAIEQIIHGLTGPQVFAGDMNFDASQDDLLQHVPRGLRDAWNVSAKSRRKGNTFPSNEPSKRIDFVFVSDEIKVREPFETIKTLASDHLPVVGSIGFR